MSYLGTGPWRPGLPWVLGSSPCRTRSSLLLWHRVPVAWGKLSSGLKVDSFLRNIQPSVETVRPVGCGQVVLTECSIPSTAAAALRVFVYKHLPK